MNTKLTLRRIVDHAMTLRPQWQCPLLPAMRDAITEVSAGAPAPTADTVRETIAAAYARYGVSISPAEVRLGIDASRLIAAATADTVVALMDPGGLSELSVHIGDGRGSDWDRGFYRGVEYLSSFDELDFRIPLPMHEPGLAQIAAAQSVTGVVMTPREQLQWVRYAQQTGMTVIHDATAGMFLTTTAPTLLATTGAAACVLETVSMAACGLAGAYYSIIPATWQGDLGTKRDVPLADVLTRYLVEPELSPLSAAGIVARYSPRGEAEWRQAITAVRAVTRDACAVADALDRPYWGGGEVPVIWTDRRTADAIVAAVPVATWQDGAVFGPAGETWVRIDLTGAMRHNKGE